MTAPVVRGRGFPRERALGFTPLAVAGIASVLALMAILVHANLDWDRGPFRSVIVSPRFHRWGRRLRTRLLLPARGRRSGRPCSRDQPKAAEGPADRVSRVPRRWRDAQ